MKGSRNIFTGLLAAAAIVGAAAIAQASDSPNNGSRAGGGNGRCMLRSEDNRIQHVVYIQFDNVHFRRDIANVSSDLEQISNLR
ncbi:MAG TPA: hypothetical protein VGH12_06970, partial [Steroidobacteraceae bacterium]